MATICRNVVPINMLEDSIYLSTVCVCVCVCLNEFQACHAFGIAKFGTKFSTTPILPIRVGYHWKLHIIVVAL